MMFSVFGVSRDYYIRNIIYGFAFTALFYAIEYFESGMVRPIFVFLMLASAFLLPYSYFIMEKVKYALFGRGGFVDSWWLFIPGLIARFVFWVMAIPLAPFGLVLSYVTNRKRTPLAP